MKKRIPLVLPCYPCPHDSVCCSWGVELTADEAKAIDARFGPGKYALDEYKDLRTKVENGRCTFHANGGCTLHDQPEYPQGCKRFPWRDGDDDTKPYQYDIDICPELTNDMDRSF